MKFINLTPHPVVVSNGALKIRFEKDPNVPTARVEQVVENKTLDYEVAPGMSLSIPINAVTRTTIYNLPEPEEGVTYICSSMVATYVKRPDVISPITDVTCERDVNGRVVSVKGFQTFCTASIDTPKIATEINLWGDPKPKETEEKEETPEVIVPKIDEDLLDPIKAAAKAKAKEKYLKRTGRV